MGADDPDRLFFARLWLTAPGILLVLLGIGVFTARWEAGAAMIIAGLVACAGSLLIR